MIAIVKELQEENALEPIDVTLLGIVIEVNNAQFLYAFVGIEVTPLGITTTD